MKIFHIGLCVYPKLEGLSLALSKAGEYTECRPEDPNILSIYDRFLPDLVFIQVQTANIIPTSVIKHMSANSVVINWMGDVRNKTERWFYEWNEYVVNCFSNMRDVEAVGGEFLQIGIDPEIFKRYAGTKGAEVVFMANRYGHFPLSRLRDRTAELLKRRYGELCKILGNGWMWNDGNLNGNQIAEAQFYSGSKIGINLSHFDIPRYSSDRIFRIMGSGCFCLSHNYQQIGVDFEVGKHLEVYNSENEMFQKIDYYLENEAERQRIANAGYLHVHNNFTYDHMVNNILEIYKRRKS